MKTTHSVSCLVAIVTLVGCASRAQISLKEPVGPAQLHADQDHENAGRLVVYSALDSTITMDSDHPAHTDYVIYDCDGKFRQRVNNRGGSFYQDAISVSLPPGTYKIKAKATNYGEVMVPVRIEAGKDTIVHLDGSGVHGST